MEPDIFLMQERLTMLESRVRQFMELYNTHTHGGITAGAGTSAATGAGFQPDSTFTLNELYVS